MKERSLRVNRTKVSLYYILSFGRVTNQIRLEQRRNLWNKILENKTKNIKSLTEPLWLTDLSIPPCFHLDHKIYFSLAHTHNFACFAIANKAIGIDVESFDRVSSKSLGRILHKNEQLNINNPTYHWCAKEAVYKSLVNHNQPRVLSEVEIEWDISSKNKFKTRKGKGKIIEIKGFVLSVFVSN